MLNKNEVGGKVEQVKGQVKKAVGDLTNDKHLKVEGYVDEAKGKVQEAVGQIRHKAGDAVDKISAAVKR